MENFWNFDQSAFKDATTLILLNDPHEKIERDLELKKLITDQFNEISDLHFWIISNFDKVDFCRSFEIFYANFRNRIIGNKH